MWVEAVAQVASIPAGSVVTRAEVEEMQTYKNSVRLGIIAVALSGLLDGIELYRPLEDDSAVAADFGLEQPDLALGGDVAAMRDLERGKRHIVMYVLVIGEQSIKEAAQKYGYSVSFAGCVMSGPHYGYWEAYNAVMVAAGRQQFGDSFSSDLFELKKIG